MGAKGKQKKSPMMMDEEMPKGKAFGGKQAPPFGKKPAGKKKGKRGC